MVLTAAAQRRFLLLATIPLFCSCATMAAPKETIKVTGLDFYPNIVSKGMEKEISIQEGVQFRNADPAAKAEARLRLALLYSDPRNPRPNYRKALESIEAYIHLDPIGSERGDIKAFHAILSHIVGLMEENRRITEDGKGLKERIEKLNTENQNLKKTVEDLKSIDIDIEEKRRQVK